MSSARHRQSAASRPLAPARPLAALLVAGSGDDDLPGEERASGRLVFDRCTRYADGLDAIRTRRHDAYVIDWSISGRPGLELVAEAFVGRPWAPVILLTPGAEPELSVEATALGVTEQLARPGLDAVTLTRTVHLAVRHQQALAELMRAEERYALAIRAANDGIWDWDLTTATLHLSARWLAILGRAGGRDGGGTSARFTLEEQPDVWFDLVHPADVGRLHAAIAGHLAGRTPHLLSEHRMRHADGSWRWVIARGLAVRGEDGAPTRMAGSLSDVTDRRNAQLRLRHDALHDTLTGLPNRTLFRDLVLQRLEAAGRQPAGRCAVLCFDIDRFKLVNDSLGHPVGDELLVELADRVATALGPGDAVARLGGDEFAVLLDDVADADGALIAAQRILRALDRPFELGAHRLFASISIGVALGDRRLGPADLIANADIAMNAAKRQGRGRAVLFDEGMRRRVVARLVRENELRQVVDGAELDIHYQPIVSLDTGAIAGLEALARWPRDRGTVAPSEFISIAEDTGIIGALGEHVLRGALETLAGWRRHGLVDDDVCMSVNVSGRQLEDPDLADRVVAAVDAAAVPARLLKLEITESTLIAEYEGPQRVFADVCARGIGLHLDDFGTGYSSLSALHRFPVDALKIDRSFVAAISEDEPGNDAIIRSTVAMAHGLGLPVIAEGIEHPGQLRRLRALHCDFGQGHLFSPARSARETGALLGAWRAGDRARLGSAA